MTVYRFNGDQPIVFATLQRDDGSTLVLQPGESVELAANPNTPWLEPIDDTEATHTATPSQASTDRSAPPEPVESVEPAGVPEPPQEPAAAPEPPSPVEPPEAPIEAHPATEGQE